MKIGIYQIKNLKNNKCYIDSAASSGGISGRWSDHKSDLNKNKHHSIKLQRAWNKYGAESFKFEILLLCDPENCLFYEQFYLDFYKPEYNISPTAGSRLGCKHTEEGRRKSAANREYKIGEDNPWFGRKHKLETIEFYKNDPRRKSFKGRKHKYESLIKISLAHQGEKSFCAKLTDDKVRKIRELRNQGFSQMECAVLFDISRTTIQDIDKRKTWSHLS